MAESRFPITETAPAKINLYLDIVGKREDGYHNLDTLFLPLPDLYDQVTVAEMGDAGGIEIDCPNTDIPVDDSNTCWKSAEFFAEQTGISPGWRIRINKTIPVCAGLGGGSTDAATVLRILNNAYGNPLNDTALRNGAATIGGDVPFFIKPQPSRARGIGEILEPVTKTADLPIILINPGIGVSTKWAYDKIPEKTPEHGEAIEQILSSLTHRDTENWTREVIGRNLFNDFEPYVTHKYVIGELLLNFLRDAPGCKGAALCGSGATVFGICESVKASQKVKQELENRFSPDFFIWTGTA